MLRCLWQGCTGAGGKGVREYDDQEEWEFHVRRMHLLKVQFACSVLGMMS